MKKIHIANKSLLVIALGFTFSQSFAGYEINKHSINIGASTMTGGSYEMSSSVAQADASVTMAQGNYSLNGGYWHPNTDLIYKNGVE